MARCLPAPIIPDRAEFVDALQLLSRGRVLVQLGDSELGWALDGAPVVLDADAGKQIAILLNGQNNGAMPAWKQLSDTEIAAVITYTKNHWSNKTGQLVQPAAVQSARQ